MDIETAMEPKTDLLSLAYDIASQAHEGQVDKAGKPYILHPLHVSARCVTYEAKVVALLHDTIEDTDITADYLSKQGFPPDIVEAVLAVTRKEGETYEEFVRRAAKNPVGREVKMADLEDNMDITRLKFPLKESDFARLNKYLWAYEFMADKAGRTE